MVLSGKPEASAHSMTFLQGAVPNGFYFRSQAAEVQNVGLELSLPLLADLLSNAFGWSLSL